MPISITDDQHTDTDFICDCNEDFRSACEGFSFYKEKDGKQYCILHYPDKNKSKDFKEALQKKLNANDFNFRGVWFPDGVILNNFEFTKVVDFGSAIFSENVSFSSATFSAYAFFNSITFIKNASFNSAIFSEYTSFRSVTFRANTDFSSSSFSGTVDFSKATFQKKSFANFYNMRFKDKVLFANNLFTSEFPLGLDGAIFEKPERVTFHTVVLCPYWFVNVDSRKFNFVNVTWRNLRNEGIKKELAKLKERNVEHPHHLLMVTYRQLAINAEENNRYHSGAEFRFMAMRVYSLELRKFTYTGLHLVRRFLRKRRSLLFWKRLWVWRKNLDPLHSLYGFASCWGEGILRAFYILVMIWILFAGIYWWGNDSSWRQKPKTEQTQTLPAP